MSDIGLFTTMLFNASPKTGDNIYAKLLSDKLPADLGYLYENAVAQMITATGQELYYHTWDKPDSTHYYEVDFLLQDGVKISPIEVKSSARRNHESIDVFCKEYSREIKNAFLFSQKDVAIDGRLKLKPIYLLPFYAGRTIVIMLLILWSKEIHGERKKEYEISIQRYA